MDTLAPAPVNGADDAIDFHELPSFSVLLVWMLWLPVIFRSKRYIIFAKGFGVIVLCIFIGISNCAWLGTLIDDLQQVILARHFGVERADASHNSAVQVANERSEPPIRFAHLAERFISRITRWHDVGRDKKRH